MGNSIYGQMPSNALRYLRENVFKRYIDTVGDETVDMHNEIWEWIDVETTYYPAQYSMSLYQMNKPLPDGENIQDVLAAWKQCMGVISKLENSSEMNKDELEEINNMTVDTIHTYECAIAVDACLLDCEYGRLQMELAKTIVNSIEFKGEIPFCIKEKNKYVVKQIQDIWASYSDEQKNSRNMQSQAVENVQPTQEGLQNWFNNSIM